MITGVKGHVVFWQVGVQGTEKQQGSDTQGLQQCARVFKVNTGILQAKNVRYTSGCAIHDLIYALTTISVIFSFNI